MPSRALLVQLPIPPVVPGPIQGNVPLAAGYLKLLARRRGLERDWRIDLLPTALANRLSDCGLVEAILERDPDLVGFTCYLWNVDRTLWIAARLKARRPDLKILLGGPEVTADNRWVLEHEAVDYAAIGEGEQTFCDLLASLADAPTGPPAEAAAPQAAGLHVRGMTAAPAFRRPLARLDDVSSPYREGILDAADERLLLLETIRGCVFKCKFCYYPKSYDDLYYLSREEIVASLRHAAEADVREVVLLDPTLNQRRDFADLLRLLAEGNPGRRFTYFGELRAEGITPDLARLMCEAGFTEVEIGLQSIDPRAMELMDRKNHLRAFERGARAMLDAGLKVKVDLIIGLPGDTVDSVRRGLRYLRDGGFYSSAQVFNLAILPGTAFRQEAKQLGLRYSPRTPYYVIRTPTLDTADLYGLMHEAQEVFDVEYDPAPVAWDEPAAPSGESAADVVERVWIDLDAVPPGGHVPLPPPQRRAQAFSLGLCGSDLAARRDDAAGLIRRVRADNPHTTLHVGLAPRGDVRCVTPGLLEELRAAALVEPSYLDRFYAMLPGPAKGATSLAILAEAVRPAHVDASWLEDVEEYATVVWGAGTSAPPAAEESLVHQD